jgi:hypothetical protein
MSLSIGSIDCRLVGDGMVAWLDEDRRAFVHADD